MPRKNKPSELTLDRIAEARTAGYITAKETAAVLNVDVRSLPLLTRREKIGRWSRPGRSVYYSRVDIAACLARRAEAAASTAGRLKRAANSLRKAD